MDIIEHGNILLQSLSHALKLEGEDRAKLVFNDDNECFISFEDRIVLIMYLDEEIRAIIVTISLGNIPLDDSREEMMYEMLCANYAWNMTDGGTLGIDKETGVMAMSYLITLPLEDVEQFEEIVSKLINVADFWMKKIKGVAAVYDFKSPGRQSGSLSSYIKV